MPESIASLEASELLTDDAAKSWANRATMKRTFNQSTGEQIDVIDRPNQREGESESHELIVNLRCIVLTYCSREGES